MITGRTRRGFGVAAAVPVEVIRATASAAESLGYDSFWVNDTPNGDGLAALAEAAAVTTTIRLGVGVIPLSRRTPESIIEQIRELNRPLGHERDVGTEILSTGERGTIHGLNLPLDRLILGVGSGAGGPGALARVQDGLAALRAALGEDVEIVISALGPKMSRLAGAAADGVLFNWLTPEYARTSSEWVRSAAREAGRDPVPTLYAYVRVALGSDGAKRLTREAARYAGIPAYGDHFRRMGVAGEQASIPAEAPQVIAEGLQSWAGMLDEVVVRAITPNDTIEETLALVEAAAPAI